MDVPFLPTLSTFFIVLSGILVAIGWALIAKRKIQAHQNVMTAAGIAAILFFIIYVSRTLFDGNTAFGGPESLKIYYTIFLVFHIILATVGAVLGLINLYTGYKKNFALHRKLGPTTSIVWFFTAITGALVYILLYVLYPGGTTEPVIKAIFGF
jgi:putative membrane protein